MATTRNVVFYNTKSSPSSDESGLRSGGCEMTILSSDVFGLSSDYRRIILESSFYWRKHSGSFRWNLELQDFVAGAVFGEVAGSLYLLHALEMTFHMWRRSGMIFILRGRRSISECWRVTFRDRRNRRIIVGLSSNRLFYWRKHSGSFRWNLELQDFVAGAVFGEVAGSLYLLHALEMTLNMWRRSGMIFILRGRRSISECWRVTFRDRRSTSWHFGRWQRREMLYFTIQNRLQAGTSQVSEAAGARWRFYRRMCSDYRRIIVGLSSNRLSIGGSIQGVSAEILSFKISWQAQYLVRLPGHFTCSTHWKWRFICDADQGWYSFCVAGAVFRNVGGWLFVTGAIVGLSSDYPRIVFLLAEAFREFSAEILRLQDFVAGAVFGEVAGSLYLLHALEMTLNMWRRSGMIFILRGRRSISECWRVTFRDRRSTSWHFGR